MSTSGTPSGHCLPLTWGLASATEEPGRPTQPACLAERGGWQEGGEQPRAPLTPSTPTTTHSHHYHHCPAKGTFDKQQSPLTSFHTDLIKLLDFCKGCFSAPALAEESIIVSVRECWNRHTVWDEPEWTNVLYSMHYWMPRLTVCLLPEFASDSFVKAQFSETAQLWEPGSISHSLLTHLAGVCVCVCCFCLCVCCSLLLSSAWLVQLWFCYYILPTDIGTGFQMHAR